MFWSIYRKEFGKEVGILFEEIERDVYGQQDAKCWLQAVFTWLITVDPLDRANCLRMAWFEHNEGTIQAEVDSRLAILDTANYRLKTVSVEAMPALRSNKERQL